MNQEVKSEDLTVGTYVLCVFKQTKSVFFQYFVGLVSKEEDEDGDLEIRFYRKVPNRINQFYPKKNDIASHSITDIQAILLKPIYTGTTERTQNIVQFPPRLSFGKIHVN